MTKAEFLACNANCQIMVGLDRSEIISMIDKIEDIKDLTDYDELFTYVKYHGIEEFAFKAKKKGVSVTYELVHGDNDTVVTMFFSYENLVAETL